MIRATRIGRVAAPGGVEAALALPGRRLAVLSRRGLEATITLAQATPAGSRLVPRWVHRVALSAQASGPDVPSLTATGEGSLLWIGGGVIHALDAATGAIHWQRPIDHATAPAGGSMVPTAGGLAGLGPDPGPSLALPAACYARPRPPWIALTPPALLHVDDGRLSPLAPDGAAVATPLAVADLVLVALGSGAPDGIHAIDAVTGAPRWVRRFDGPGPTPVGPWLVREPLALAPAGVAVITREPALRVLAVEDGVDVSHRPLPAPPSCLGIVHGQPIAGTTAGALQGEGPIPLEASGGDFPVQILGWPGLTWVVGRRGGIWRLDG